MHCLGQLNHLNCLLLDTFDSRNHQDNHVSDFGTSRAHIYKGLVTWSVDESDLSGHSLHVVPFVGCPTWDHSAVTSLRIEARVLNCEGTDSLCNRSVLLGTLVMIGTERVEQGCLSVVDMTHDCDNRGPGHVSARLTRVFIHDLRINVHLHANKFDCFVCQDLKLVSVNIVCELDSRSQNI